MAYEINPWMNVRRQPQAAMAQRQWLALRAMLEHLADTVEIASLADAPDMVFTANAGFAHRQRVLLSRFRHVERRIEEAAFRRWFEAHGFETFDCPPSCHFEGEGDALRDPGGGRLWFGHGIRSDRAALPALRRVFDAEIVPLRLISAHFYHLDTCLCPLPGGAVMLYPPALSAASQLQIYKRVPAKRRIAVDARDARAFACNALVLGSKLILNRCSIGLRQRLADLGLKVIECPVDAFIRAGGAVKCLTLHLD